jgi:CubicO group peptidase (beta-lactamase class C family)
VLDESVSEGKIPGGVAAAATDSGVVHETAAGVRETGQSAPMTPDTVFWLASMTKPITAAAAMQLVERGKLELDAPATETAPQLGNVQVLEGFDTQGQPRLRPPRAPITLRNLLTHTSGFGYEYWNEDLKHYTEVTGEPGARSRKKALLKGPLVADPGTRWEYGIGIDWVGQLVEAVSGQLLGDYLASELFTPLGMTSTAFAISPEMRAHLASLHARQPDGTLAPKPSKGPAEYEFQMGGGGLYGTPRDYLRFLRMLLGGGALEGTRVLKTETVALMGHNHMGELNVRALPTTDTALSKDIDLLPGTDCKWGLSFLINTAATAQGRSAGSLAWAGLANTYFWIDPVRRVTGLFMSQISPFLDDGAVETFQHCEAAVYQNLA